MMTTVLLIVVVVGLIAAYSLGEWIGAERERIRQQHRKANVLDFTPRIGKDR